MFFFFFCRFYIVLNYSLCNFYRSSAQQFVLFQGSGRWQVKNKVIFADDVVESSSNNEKY
ncbi:hypothetical protein Syun_003817 [Stephania yunnanensis]|uniref:Secreted protein n=1 Tax=Stephania yunnanensis TaxID=152371 RepID=A0AAP0L4G4_9MAGN